MKTAVKKEPNKMFEPFIIEFKIESKEDLAYLYHIFNLTKREMLDSIAGDDEFNPINMSDKLESDLSDVHDLIQTLIDTHDVVI